MNPPLEATLGAPTATPSAAIPASAIPSSAIRRVVVVESDSGDMERLVDCLPDGIELVHVSDLHTLESRLRQGDASGPPDVLLLNLSLPEVQGLETFHRVRRLVPSVPIIVLTGSDDVALAAEAISLGAQDFVSKADLGSMPKRRMERVLLYARERHELRQALDDAMAERALREELFRSIADDSNSLVFRCSLVPELSVDFLNAATEAVTGLRVEEVIADPQCFLERIHEGDLEGLGELGDDEPGFRGPQVFRFRHVDGSLRHLERSMSVLTDRAGTPIVVQGVIRDVTANEVEREQLRHELVEKEREVADARAQKLEGIGRLAAGMAHELNTPIQFVSDNVRFVQSSVEELLPGLRKIADDPGLASDLREVVDAFDLEFLEEELGLAVTESLEGLERMGRLVSAVKEFAHPGQAGKVAADLNRLIETTVTVSRNEWKYVAEVDLDLDENLPLVPVEADQVKQVMLNLIVNAGQAIAEVEDAPTGRIQVCTRFDADAREAVLCVRDNGPGIPAEIIEQIWEPFFTTKEVGVGSGQGLAIARSLVVDRHGGTIDVQSSPQGTRFDIRLPIAEQEAGA